MEKSWGGNPLPPGTRKASNTYFLLRSLSWEKNCFCFSFLNYHSNQGTILFGRWYWKVISTCSLCSFSRNFTCSRNEQVVVRKPTQPRLCYPDQARFSWADWHGVGSVQKIPADHPEAFFAPQTLPMLCCLCDLGWTPPHVWAENGKAGGDGSQGLF